MWKLTVYLWVSDSYPIASPLRDMNAPTCCRESYTRNDHHHLPSHLAPAAVQKGVFSPLPFKDTWIKCKPKNAPLNVFNYSLCTWSQIAAAAHHSSGLLSKQQPSCIFWDLDKSVLKKPSTWNSSQTPVAMFPFASALILNANFSARSQESQSWWTLQKKRWRFILPIKESLQEETLSSLISKAKAVSQNLLKRWIISNQLAGIGICEGLVCRATGRQGMESQPWEVLHTPQHVQALQSPSRTTTTQLTVHYLHTSVNLLLSPGVIFSNAGLDISHSSSPWHECPGKLQDLQPSTSILSPGSSVSNLLSKEESISTKLKAICVGENEFPFTLCSC